MLEGWFAKDLGIGAAEVVAIEEDKVDELPDREKRGGKLKGIGGGGGWGSDKFDGWPGGGEELGCGIVADGDAVGRRADDQEFRLTGQEFTSVRGWGLQSEEDFVAMGVDGGGLDFRLRGKNFEA
jgi:hypothetical protein